MCYSRRAAMDAILKSVNKALYSRDTLSYTLNIICYMLYFLKLS